MVWGACYQVQVDKLPVHTLTGGDVYARDWLSISYLGQDFSETVFGAIFVTVRGASGRRRENTLQVRTVSQAVRQDPKENLIHF